jgi:ABC-type sugar transport system ATPase subunit
VIAAPSATPACAVRGVRKSYGGVQALTGVDLQVYPGTVHAIVGENGAGKSTLMKILAGAEQPDAGEVFVNGQRVILENVRQANEHGIAIVFQELSLFPDLDVLANLFLLREPRRLGIIQRSEMKRRAKPVLDAIGLHVNLDAPVASLSLGERQLVEIARALLYDSAILILDEPNSALNATESERLFAVVRALRERGVAVIYVSHRLEEVLAIADVITVVRNGAIVDTVPKAEATIPRIVTSMIGRKLSETYPRRGDTRRAGSPLRLEHVTVEGRIYDISLAAAPGEVLGLAGLEGAGVSAIFDVIFGITTPDAGTVSLPDGKPAPRGITEAVRAGIALVPSDRKSAGLMLDQSVLTNTAMVSAGALGQFGIVLNWARLEARVRARTEALQVRTSSIWAPVNQLSGGNQQKVVLAKWLEANPGVILLDDPTRGVDIGAKIEIYHIINTLAREGRVVLFASSELPELVNLCDRVIVLYQGRIRGELYGPALTEHRLLEAINTGEV